MDVNECCIICSSAIIISQHQTDRLLLRFARLTLDAVSIFWVKQDRMGLTRYFL